MVLYSIFGRIPRMIVRKLVDNLELYRKNLLSLLNPKNFAGSRNVDDGIVFNRAASKVALLTNTIGCR